MAPIDTKWLLLILKMLATPMLATPMLPTHHVYFEFQPKKKLKDTLSIRSLKYSTDPYKHEMAAPYIQTLNGSEIETII